ncbi:ATP-dependent nuclease [Xanthomonas oryzae]|uniref:ATP-dependent nuclease n=1 Tax=Xanthomonas oryzae TaxID=347 RepID=UPI001F5FB50F|nr:ATP-binding protein [Xanthomonas oryzae]
MEKFKRIDAIKLPVADLNILVGSNGSGKSSILQALHLASCLMRQADRIRAESTAMVSINDLDYLPSDQYWKLGHGADWGNKGNSPSSKVEFHFLDDAAGVIPPNIVTAKLVMRSARNAGISVQGELPESVRPLFRGQDVFFSGFIPGISGIPNVEHKNSKRVVLKACSFGDSNVYLRNALNLLAVSEIVKIEEWLEPLLGPLKLKIVFDESKDFEIRAHAELNGRSTPLELLGTGFLQLIQIFCYILLFKPKILLIDEPDIHLHPTVQEKLAASLLEIARAQGIKIVMSTHSPFIVRGAPVDANVVWLADGEIKSEDRSVVELALGWGAFGKQVIIVSEDAKNELLKKLIRQWPEIERSVTVLPGRGYKHLLTRSEAEELRASLGGKFKILVHRDRDSLTDDEATHLVDSYAAEGIALWLTDQSDIESEFCKSSFLSSLTGESSAVCDGWIDQILTASAVPIYDQFSSQRAAHNGELHSEGGSPANADVWAQFQHRPLRGAKGKYVMGQLKNVVPGKAYSEVSVEGHSGFPEIAPSLKNAIETLITHKSEI